MSECVKVAVRCRPLSEEERREGDEAAVEVSESGAEVFLRSSRTAEPKQFTFDYVFGPTATQKQLYEQCAFDVVGGVLEGYNATIFAYGQTGAGKTHTMEGRRECEEGKGVIPRALEHIFAAIEGTTSTKFLVYVSMLELYNEDIFDLLAPQPEKQRLELKERAKEGFVVRDLSTHDTRSAAECLALLSAGSLNRSTAATAMNHESSRSHSLFCIAVESSQADGAGGQIVRRGKLNLVDLAGSERQKKTLAVGRQLEEAKKINLSLVCLGKVIAALVQNDRHVPYRDSKLTRLLCDSLGGNTKTLMIANLGCAARHYDESLSTLRYAYQAKSIRNKPRINEDPKDAKLREVETEIAKLREYLRGADGAAGELLPEARQAFLADRARLDAQHSAELERILQMKQISAEERNRLLEQLRESEESHNRECAERQALIEKISGVQSKVIEGRRAQAEIASVQQEIARRRALQEKLEKERRRYEKEAADAEIEKGLLERKYQSQVEELREKEALLAKIDRRHAQLKADHAETAESFGSQLKALNEEQAELLAQVASNAELMDKYLEACNVSLIERVVVYDPERDVFLLNDHADEEARLCFQKFALMKSIQERPTHVDPKEESFLLFGHEDPFHAFTSR